jgi:hypothetical protein
MAGDDLLLQTLQRIESKVDNSIVNHAERLAKVETRMDGVEDDIDKQELRGWVKTGLGYLAVMASHFGLSKAGFKI